MLHWTSFSTCLHKTARARAHVHVGHVACCHTRRGDTHGARKKIWADSVVGTQRNSTLKTCGNLWKFWTDRLTDSVTQWRASYRGREPLRGRGLKNRTLHSVAGHTVHWPNPPTSLTIQHCTCVHTHCTGVHPIHHFIHTYYTHTYVLICTHM